MCLINTPCLARSKIIDLKIKSCCPFFIILDRFDRSCDILDDHRCRFFGKKGFLSQKLNKHKS